MSQRIDCLRGFVRLDSEPAMLGKPKSRQLDEPILVSLDFLVPKSHFYRHLEHTLDLAFVRELVHGTYADIGRPSIDPVVFFKLQLILFFEGLRSERQLMRVVADRLSLRWYLGCALSEELPNHSSLTRIRERYGVAVFRRFFEAVVEQCIAAGLVWGRELYIDSTNVAANASIDSLQPRFAVEAHLTRLFVEERAGEDDRDDDRGEHPDQHGGEDAPLPLPVVLTDEAHAEQADSAANRHDWIGEMGRPDRTSTSGPYRRTADFRASATDPDASPLRPSGSGARLGYHDHYVVDGGKARIILTALVTPAEVQDNQPAVDLLWRTRFRWKLHPRLVTADSKYGTVENIVAIEDQRIRAYLPLSKVASARMCSASRISAMTRRRMLTTAPATRCCGSFRRATQPTGGSTKRGRPTARRVRSVLGAQPPHEDGGSAATSTRHI